MDVNETSVPSGFLFVDKPVGPTSHDVVGKIRWILKTKLGTKIKVGHAGTLDPLASGLLILGVGKATKSLGQLFGCDKTYEVEVTLGATTGTDDAEGEPQPVANAVAPDKKEIKDALAKFVGEQMQTPPAFSAKKQDGIPLYKLARRGKAVSPKPHTITIHSIELVEYSYPTLRLTVHCSSGTYIRSLARDIGEALTTGGYVNALRRTAIAQHKVDEAVSFADAQENPEEYLRPLETIITEIEK